MSKKRLNIGLLISEMEDAYTRSVCNGAISASKELDANIFIFPGKYLKAEYHDAHRTRFDYQHNSVFDYAKTTKFDVLLVCLGTIGSNIGMEEKMKFLEQFKGTPVITISATVPGYPSVRIENTIGFKDGVRHLIEKHQCKKIGFVSGPETSGDACERLQAFREVMQENSITIEDKQIVYGNFSEYSHDVVRKLLNANPNLDAIVFANDMMALSGYDVLKERGIQVGEDIAVMGYDDAPCATTLEPSLSTVRADALELGYRAVISFPDIIAGRVSEVLVNSEFVQRQSCGCNNAKNTNLHLTREDLSDNFDAIQTLDRINLFLFGKNSIQSGAGRIKTRIVEYVVYYRKHFMKEEISDEEWNGLAKRMKKICRIRLEPYTNADKIFELFKCIYEIGLQSLKVEQQKRLTNCMFEVYKDATKYTQKRYEAKQDDASWLNVIATTFTRDILNFAIDDDRAYYSITDKLSQLYFKRAYICMLEEYYTRHKDDETKIPEYFLIKSYLKDGQAFFEEGNQKIAVDQMLHRLFEDSEERATVMITLLFSTDEQYGLFVSEIDEEHLNYIIPVTYQISSAVKTIDLLRNKEVITTQLEKSLEQIKESNAILDELSKSDELTQIYNRRGFLTTAQHQILHPSNAGKEAVMIYADMNNLKIINDQFGHEEGDYSLKLIATILKEAFPDGIVGRFGGDEFAAFAFLDCEKPTTEVKRRINELTKAHNEDTDKPYYVSMSVGVCEFICKDDCVIQEIMDKADVDLYVEKKCKRNNVLK